MTSARERSESELNSLLNRALRSVPYVRLDAVDRVTEYFQTALQLMEDNLEFEDSDEDNTSASNFNNNSTLNSDQQDFRNRSSGSGLDSSRVGLSSAAATEKETVEIKKAIASKLIGNTVTKDYSSPSAAKRSLAQANKPQPQPNQPIRIGQGKAQQQPPSNAAVQPSSGSSGLGLGLGVGKKNQLPPGAAAQMAPHHKPSSRVSSSSTTQHVNAPSSQQTSSGDQSEHDEDAPIRVARPLGVGGAAAQQQQTMLAASAAPKNKLLSRAASGSQREFPSPKLGGRSLGGTPLVNASARLQQQQKQQPQHFYSSTSPTSPRSATANDDDESTPQLTDAVHLDKQAHESSSNSQAASGNEENVDESQADNESSDLIATSKPMSAVSKLKAAEVSLPVTASPKQFKSSLMLLSLAKKEEAGLDEDDLTKPTNPNAVDASKQSFNAPSSSFSGIALSSLPSSVVSTSSSNQSGTSSGSSTPKPAFLRRLDSPESHHGQLLSAKARLQIIINKALQTVPNIKLEAQDKILQALRKAVEELEANTVQPLHVSM